MSGSFNALSRFGVPDRPFRPVVGRYGGSFIPQPGAGAPVDMPMPGQPMPALGLGALTVPSPVYSGAEPNTGFDPGLPQTSMYDPQPSPNQTWGGLLDALANAAMFALSPIGFAAGFIGTAAANPNATLVGQPLLDMFGIPTATQVFTGALPGYGDTQNQTRGQTNNLFGGLSFSDDAYSGWGFIDGLLGSTEGPDMGHDTPGGAGTGGTRHEGGYIEGRGEVPITALAGEYVIRPEAVRRYGRQAMDALNSGAVPRNALAKYAR